MKQAGWLSVMALWFLWTAIIPVCASDAPEGEIKNALEKKVFTLTHPYIAQRLKFDPAGNLLGENSTGPWTVYGLVDVKKVAVKNDGVRILGVRVYVRYPGPEPNYVRTDRRLRIDLSWPLGGAHDWQALKPVLSHVFLTENDKLADFVPQYWKPYLTDRAEHLKQMVKRAHESGRIVFNGRTVYTLSGHVAPLHAIQAPDPMYTDAARQAKLQGHVVLLVVVNEAGKVVDPFIITPLGMGLDDQMVDTVTRYWRFDPVTIDGKPVPVLVNIESNFRLW